MSETTLSGVLPVIQTPFHADGSFDLESLAKEVDWAFANGASGLVLGMVSEIMRLSADERLVLSQATIAAAGGRPVIANCSAESEVQAVAMARQLEAAGAAGLMAIPPTHVSIPSPAIVDYFAAIFEATTISIVVQDASAYVGEPMGPEVLSALRDRFGARVLAKPEASPIGPNLSKLRDATGGTVKFYEGTGGIALIDSFRRGIAGTMPAVDLVWAVRAAWDALVAKDDEAAYAVIGAMSGIIVMQTQLDIYVAIEKYLLVRQGVIPAAHQRGPIGYSIDPESRAEIDRLFNRLDRVVATSGYDPRKR
ncbi:MAG: dihydrodipicolinate synthase family protein [Devosia sp.]